MHCIWTSIGWGQSGCEGDTGGPERETTKTRGQRGDKFQVPKDNTGMVFYVGIGQVRDIKMIPTDICMWLA